MTFFDLGCIEDSSNKNRAALEWKYSEVIDGLFQRSDQTI